MRCAHKAFPAAIAVLIVLPDSVEFVAAFFGAAKIGAVAVP